MPRAVTVIKPQDIVPASTTETLENKLTKQYDCDLGFALVRHAITRNVNGEITGRTVTITG